MFLSVQLGKKKDLEEEKGWVWWVCVFLKVVQFKPISLMVADTLHPE